MDCSLKTVKGASPKGNAFLENQLNGDSADRKNLKLRLLFRLHPGSAPPLPLQDW